MSARLLSLEILPRSETSLRFPRHDFGDPFTFLVGENGAGKSPLMLSLFWALGGYRRPDGAVWDECSGVSVQLKRADGAVATIFRAFEEKLRATIQIGEVTRIFEIGEVPFTKAIFECLGIPPREVVNKTDKKKTVLYTGVLLPGFCVDQDSGWVLTYAPYDRQNFVEDQAEEVARLLLDLEPRHDADREHVRGGLERKLERAEAEVYVLSRAIDSLETQRLQAESRDAPTLRNVREQLQARLTGFDSVVTAFTEAQSTLQERLLAAREELDEVGARLRRSEDYLATLDQLSREAEADLSVVGSNEVAARAFRSFCANASCQMFEGSRAVSYGRRVLYLRDQLKDVSTAMKSAAGEIAALRRRRAAAEAQVMTLRREVDELSKKSAASQITSALDAVVSELGRVTTGLHFAEQLEVERARRNDLVAARDRAQLELDDHRAASSKRHEQIGEKRTRLRDKFVAWLSVLRTNDIANLGISDGFRILVRGKALADSYGPGGSTRTRLILAFHAAMLEVALETGGGHPGLLLFDSPVQQELDPVDFEAYVAALRSLAEAHPGRVQMVMASRTPIGVVAGDATWSPEYPGEKHPWYLGRPLAKKGPPPDEAPPPPSAVAEQPAKSSE